MHTYSLTHNQHQENRDQETPPYIANTGKRRSEKEQSMSESMSEKAKNEYR